MIFRLANVSGFLALAVVGLGCSDTAPVEDDPTSELVCDDQIDNDQDEQMDCADSDCAFVAESEGACINENDLPAFVDMDLNVEWNACVVTAGCQLDTDCLAGCFSERNATSLECSYCFADVVPCVVSSCASVCGNGGGSPECLACIGTECTPAYRTCFGQLACEFEYGCRDGIDNDLDGATDAADDDCAG